MTKTAEGKTMKYYFEKLKTNKGDAEESIEIPRVIALHLEGFTFGAFDQAEMKAKNTGGSILYVSDYAQVRITTRKAR